MRTEYPEELDGDGETNHPLPKDLMFDQWANLSESVVGLIEPIVQLVLSALGPKDRKPRADLVLGIEAIVSAIIANLIVLHFDRPKGSLLVTEMERRKRTRYDRPRLRKLPEVVDVLHQAGLIIRYPAVSKQKRTTIEPTDSLKRLLAFHRVRVSDVTRAEGEELIVLTARPEVRRIAGEKQPKVLVDYADTEGTVRLRAEMEEINRFLSSRSIVLEGGQTQAFRLHRKFTLRSPTDPIAFNLHGRLYGGFWTTLEAAERHRIRIDGEPIADLDFASMFPRLAYRHVGKEPPPGDLYAIPGLENHRDGAKAALSALLSHSDELRSLPSRVKKELPDGWTASRVKKAFAAFHPDLVPLFGRDFGLDLMFTESRILLVTLRRLMAQGIPALPMHDGIMVPASRSREGKAAMEDASGEIAGVRLPVTLKTQHQVIPSGRPTPQVLPPSTRWS